VTHLAQTLANGSHIYRTTSKLVFQDEQGRFRMEAMDGRQVVIQDTVAMVIYNIDREQRTARRIRMGPTAVTMAQRIAGDVSPVEEARAVARRIPNNLVEDLGSRFINGVMALGVRVTTTIPTGAIGNDQELKSVEERWYSNDIHALVRTVTTDPRIGVATYELTHIVRSAPDPALFQVPAGFAVTTVDNAPPPQ
jgi:outer membrane lipoprotein-sorting protein